MNKHPKHSLGFVLIEALVALLVVAFAALAISKITTVVLSSAGDSRARAEALLLAEGALEQLRNNLTQAQYASALPASATNSATVAGATASFTVATTITTPVTGSLQRLLQVSVSWTSSANESLSVNLSSEVAWDNAENQAANQGGGFAQTTINPRGAARRGTGYRKTGSTWDTAVAPYVPANANTTPAFVYSNGGTSELIDSTTGKIILVTDGNFVTISGKVYFEPGANIPDHSTFLVRLSSEGECIFKASNSLSTEAHNSKNYPVLPYTCYVGEGWYGNVGVSSSSTTGNFTSCVGDPGFNSGNPNGTLMSPHARESAVRTYRGFEKPNSTYLSTGASAASGSNAYPSLNTGAPKPASATLVDTSNTPGLGYTLNGQPDQLENHFYVSRLTGQQTCKSTMPATAFFRNAGEFLCLTPDSKTSASDWCPAIWPNFESFVASGGGSGGGGGGSTCTTLFKGSNAYTGSGSTISINSNVGSCTKNGGNFTCSGVVAASGTVFTITSTKTSNQGVVSTVSGTAAANCSEVNGINLQ
jgi:Tfp pilus assembly protein PilV